MFLYTTLNPPDDIFIVGSRQSGAKVSRSYQKLGPVAGEDGVWRVRERRLVRMRCVEPVLWCSLTEAGGMRGCIIRFVFY